MRKQDWPEIMAAAIAAARGRAFAWGSHDCCLFAADVVRAMTGVDHAAPFRGRYSTARGAAMALKRYAGGGLLAAVTRLLGDPVPGVQARRGDVVYAETALGPAIGICIGPAACFAAPAGLACLPLSACLHAWRID